ncbi:hypothetical protein GCM10008955_41250 [Deinococcus malanensis]|uniref:Uncharacterized protein n=1 Tax=Deinococcus malanensis TaxID=1706855 RepID=A0ABQ2F265_9DEIO|nr:hypothetical protein GCM10008955_41250 [Deinococcus malanensis]
MRVQVRFGMHPAVEDGQVFGTAVMCGEGNHSLQHAAGPGTGRRHSGVGCYAPHFTKMGMTRPG